MLYSYFSYIVLFSPYVASANPIIPRAVDQLNEEAFKEAQQRDDTATRAFSNVNIKTSDGKCLTVDKLSGDFRANLTPIQVLSCGDQDGQGWDVITAEKHDDQPGQAVFVNTLTQACVNFDPRRKAGNQVLMFSCGGRADGGGQVTNSQLFPFDNKSSTIQLAPQNSEGKCLAVSGSAIDIADCDNSAATQQFTIGSEAAGGSNGGEGAIISSTALQTETKSTADEVSPTTTLQGSQGTACTGERVTVTNFVTVTMISSVGGASSEPGPLNSIDPVSTPTTSVNTNKITNVVATTSFASTTDTILSEVPPSSSLGPVAVSRAGGTLNPSAVAEAQKFDSSATRSLESVNIRAADGRCLSVDATAGDFRENLIPVQLAKCNEDQSQKFDVITKGEHNDGTGGGALVVSVSTNGCLSFDGRRQAGDTVTIFSCGGRADGGGGTDSAQLYPFNQNTNKIVLQPLTGDSQTCLIAGEDRLDSANCDNNADQVFDLVAVL